MSKIEPPLVETVENLCSIFGIVAGVLIEPGRIIPVSQVQREIFAVTDQEQTSG